MSILIKGDLVRLVEGPSYMNGLNEHWGLGLVADTPDGDGTVKVLWLRQRVTVSVPHIGLIRVFEDGGEA